jgi:hypothetical protein
VLPLDALPPAPRLGGVVATVEFFKAVLERHEDGSLACRTVHLRLVEYRGPSTGKSMNAALFPYPV